MNLNEWLYNEAKKQFEKDYPAEFKDVFVNKDKVDIKYSSTKWHSYKFGFNRGYKRKR